MEQSYRELRTAGVMATLVAMMGVVMADRTFAASETLPVLVDPRASGLVSMEREFCSTVAKLGIRDGFLRYFSPDGILFRPNPVVALEYFPTRPPTPASLIWTPELADVSAAGDLGYTFGPWEMRPAGLEDTTFANGTYVTLWRLEPDETWKIVLDWGIGHEIEPAKTELLGQAITAVRDALASSSGDAPSAQVRAATTRSTITDLTIGNTELLEADRALVNTPDSDRLASDCRFLREGHPPLVGLEALRSAVGTEARPASSTPDRGFISRSGDLGYVYGSCAASGGSTSAIGGEAAAASTNGDDQETPSAYFLRIWKKSDGRWQVVLELVTT